MGSGVDRGLQRPCWDSGSAGKLRQSCAAHMTLCEYLGLSGPAASSGLMEVLRVSHSRETPSCSP